MRISDIGNAHFRNSQTISGNATVHELSQLLKEENIGAVVVSNDGKSVDGIISERDIAYGLCTRRGDFHMVRVATLMTKHVINCSVEGSVKDALLLMAEHHIRHVPVMDKGTFVFLLSMRDVIELRLGALEKRTSVLKAFVETY